MTPEQLSAIERISRMRDSGALTDAEFEEQKRRILSWKPARSSSGGVLLLIGALFFVGYLVVTCSHDGEMAMEKPLTGPGARSSTSSSSGEYGEITTETLGGATMEDFDEVNQRLSVKDFTGLAKMTLSGKAASIPKGTRVLITDIGFSWKRVRCQDGPYKNEEYYVATENVR